MNTAITDRIKGVAVQGVALGHLARKIRTLSQKSATSQWEIGDLLVQELPIGKAGKIAGTGFALDWLSENTGISVKKLRMLRHTAAQWPKEYRMPGWAPGVHSRLSSCPDKKAIFEARMKGDNFHTLTTKFAPHHTSTTLTPGWRTRQATYSNISKAAAAVYELAQQHGYTDILAILSPWASQLQALVTSQGVSPVTQPEDD